MKIVYAIVISLFISSCSHRKSLTAEEMAREVFQGIRDNDIDRLQSLAMSPDEFMALMEEHNPDFKAKPAAEKKKLIEDDLKHRLTTIKEDCRSIRRQFCDHGNDWDNAIFTRSFHKIDTVEKTEFSAILVSFEYNRRLEYFEIECIKTAGGWKIFDDLNFGSLSTPNEEYIRQMHPVPPVNSKSTTPVTEH